jgi:hypothetical protein
MTRRELKVATEKTAKKGSYTEYSAPHQDLREWLDRVDNMGELQKVDGADWNLEIGAVAEMLYHATPEDPSTPGRSWKTLTATKTLICSSSRFRSCMNWTAAVTSAPATWSSSRILIPTGSTSVPTA